MTDVTHSIPDGALSGLPPKLAATVLKVMARISEASYRRGYQQRETFDRLGIHCVDPVTFRFRTSLDLAPFADSFATGPTWVATQGRRTALWRLDVEYGSSLERIGLPSDSGRVMQTKPPRPAGETE